MQGNNCPPPPRAWPASQPWMRISWSVQANGPPVRWSRPRLTTGPSRPWSPSPRWRWPDRMRHRPARRPAPPCRSARAMAAPGPPMPWPTCWPVTCPRPWPTSTTPWPPCPAISAPGTARPGRNCCPPTCRERSAASPAHWTWTATSQKATAAWPWPWPCRAVRTRPSNTLSAPCAWTPSTSPDATRRPSWVERSGIWSPSRRWPSGCCGAGWVAQGGAARLRGWALRAARTGAGSTESRLPVTRLGS